MALRVKNWMDWQGRTIRDIARKRQKRGTTANRKDMTIALGRIDVASSLDGDFENFADIVGGRNAETFLLRTLQFAALNDGARGRIRIERKHFGRFVLSRPWDVVGRKLGEKVYDALLSTGICVTSNHQNGDTAGVTVGAPGGDTGGAHPTQPNPTAARPDARTRERGDGSANASPRSGPGYESLRETIERMGIAPAVPTKNLTNFERNG